VFLLPVTLATRRTDAASPLYERSLNATFTQPSFVEVHDTIASGISEIADNAPLLVGAACAEAGRGCERHEEERT
jgi:hypothetical protein